MRYQVEQCVYYYDMGEQTFILKGFDGEVLVFSSWEDAENYLLFSLGLVGAPEDDDGTIHYFRDGVYITDHNEYAGPTYTIVEQGGAA